jgi:STE24 endopeptidase
MSAWSQRISHRKWLSTPIYITIFLLTSFLLDMPLSIYTDFVREQQYGLTEQAFSGWLGDQAVVIAVNAAFSALLLTAIYAAVRRAGARWWLWASGLAFSFLMVFSLILPVYIAPMLNDYKPLPAGPTRDIVLSALRANDIPTSHVDWFDASKQTTRQSANVSGLLGTTRIALNDNLLNKSSLPEIKAVLGHEMGHYVLNHVWKEPILLGLTFGLCFVLLHLGMDQALLRWGGRLQLSGRADPAALPLAWALAVIIFLLLTPILNSITRSYEGEADAFGINAAHEPHGWAMAVMRLSTYRKLKPGAFEEFVFYDHPSGYERIRKAMLWLKENQGAVAAAELAANPATTTGSGDKSAPAQAPPAGR